jgi:hypothetical protein
MPAAKASLRKLRRFVCNGRHARFYYNGHGRMDRDKHAEDVQE